MPTEACLVHLVHSEVLVDGLDGMVIIGQQSSKSTFGANNGAMKKDTKVGCTLECKRPNIFELVLGLK